MVWEAADFVQLETVTFNLETECCSHQDDSSSQSPPTVEGLEIEGTLIRMCRARCDRPKLRGSFRISLRTLVN